MKRTISSIWPYAILSIAHVILLLTIGKQTQLTSFTKVLLMPVLICYVWNNLSKPSGSTKLVIIVALFFSWIGDILLLSDFEPYNLFVFGLLSFLVAQVIYTYAFKRATYKKNTSKKWLAGAIGLATFGMLMLDLIWDQLFELKLPVSIYVIAILTMGAAAFWRADRTNRKSYQFGVLGAILFIFSDSCIAINSFYHPFELSSVVIMVTYLLAQFFILQSLIIHVDHD